MAKDHGPSVKNDKQYEGLKKKRMSKSRAAAIANSEGSSSRGGSPLADPHVHAPATDQVEPLRVEWASAVVEDARLTVGLDGEPATEWGEGFGPCSSVCAVRSVRGARSCWRDGASAWRTSPKARSQSPHLLESAVLQANASAGLTTPDPGDGEGDDGGEDGPTADQEMTERFRSFAERPH